MLNNSQWSVLCVPVLIIFLYISYFAIKQSQGKLIKGLLTSLFFAPLLFILWPSISISIGLHEYKYKNRLKAVSILLITASVYLGLVVLLYEFRERPMDNFNLER
jgi:hypothetical protein